MAKNHEISAYFIDKGDLRVMSHTAITSKFKVRWFPNEGCH